MMKEILGLLGGLALFLYGMHMMSAGMEAAAGDKLKTILEKLTSNRYMGVLVGMVITAFIQSSSATTVMVVGFVNSGMMTLRQTVGIIMGANIGTTITGQLIALDAGAIAPLIAIIGVIAALFSKNQKANYIGSILAGLGILFIGMDMMSTAMLPLRDSETFVGMMTEFSNPILGILAGTIFTAVIQSSSASVGILQALAVSGTISLSSGVYVLFGQNIGTCVTALLASIGTNRNAKRTTVIHLTFNMIGTLMFTIICMLTPLTSFMESLTPNNPAAQIANMHTLFNVVVTLSLLPFANLLASFAEKVLPDKAEKDASGNLITTEGVTEKTLLYLKDIKSAKEGKIGVSAISLEQLHKEMLRMMDLARLNIKNSFTSFLYGESKWRSTVEKREDCIDYLNGEISSYISRIMTYEKNERGGELFSAYFTITGNIERIADHAMNICGYSSILEKKKIQLSQEAQEEIIAMQDICEKLMEILLQDDDEALNDLRKVPSIEQKIDDMTETYRGNMLRRIKAGLCSEEGCILYSEMLTDFERIGDHALNISEQLLAIYQAR